MISIEEVKKLTELARIAVPDAELEELRADLDRILDYVGQVQKLAGEKVDRDLPEHRNVFRDDREPHEPGKYTEAILKQAPDRSGDYIRVKKVLEQGR